MHRTRGERHKELEGCEDPRLHKLGFAQPPPLHLNMASQSKVREALAGSWNIPADSLLPTSKSTVCSVSHFSLWEWLCLRVSRRTFLRHSVRCFGYSPRRPTKKMYRDSFILYHVTRKQQWQLTNHYIFHNTDKLQLVTNMQRVLLHSPYYMLFWSIIVFWMMLAHFLGTNHLLESTHLRVSYRKKDLKNPLPTRECRFYLCL